MGFESYLCLYNLGTQAIVIVLVCLFFFLNWPFYCYRKSSHSIKNCQKKVRGTFKYRFFLRMMRELYFIFLICAVINLYYLKFSTYG